MKIKIKSGLRLKMLRTSIFFCIRTYPTKLITYDTSFLKRRQVVINGDVESNPGPVFINRKDIIDITLFLFLVTFLQVILYGIFLTTMYVYFTEFMKFLILTMTYGYSCWIVYHSSELLSLTFRKMSKKNELMRKPSLPKGTTKVHTLVPCSYLYTFVLDGRDGKTQIQEIKIDNEKMKKNYNKMVNVWSYILDISFWLYVSYAVFMISNKLSLWLYVSNTIFVTSKKLITNSPFNYFNGNRLLLILLSLKDLDNRMRKWGEPVTGSPPLRSVDRKLY